MEKPHDLQYTFKKELIKTLIQSERIQGALRDFIFANVICDVELHAELGMAVIQRLFDRGRLMHTGKVGFLLKNVTDKEGRQRWISTRWLPNSMTILWYTAPGKRTPVPVMIFADGKVKLRYIRGTLDVTGLVRDVITNANAQADGRFQVIRVTGGSNTVTVESEGKEGRTKSVTTSAPLTRGSYFKQAYRGIEILGATDDELRPPPPMGRADNLWLCDTAKSVLADATKWHGNYKWYQAMKLAWKRGYLLYGRPGTGKTSLARAMAIALDIPIYAVDLGSMNNRDVQQAWTEAVANTPCMILLEDIDGIYHGRTPVKDRNGGTPPSFDTVLNLIDGADQNNGIITVLTSNDIDKVDSAIGGRLNAKGKTVEAGTRPGRIDYVVPLPDALSAEGQHFVANRLLSGRPDLVSTALDHAKNQVVTPAQFQEVCIRLLVE